MWYNYLCSIGLAAETQCHPTGLLYTHQDDIAGDGAMFKELKANKISIAVRKPVFGVGINDADYMVNPTINGKKLWCPYHRTWHNIMTRCYSDAFHAKCPTYIDATVCDEWHLFTTFKEWMVNQDWEGNHLDKDVRVPGNKHYSPETCCFVSHAVNKLLTDCAAKRGKYPQGVTMDKRRGKYRACINKHCKVKHIGYFHTISEAESTYRKAKSSHITEIALEQLNPLIRDGLLRHAAIFHPTTEDESDG
jgi:hypothetical protein